MLTLTVCLCAQTNEPQFPQRIAQFRALAGIYEPSGVVQLADGRLLIVEDEASRSLSLLSFDTEGDMQVLPLWRNSLLSEGKGLHGLGELNDLEGLAMDGNGYVYAVTSYSHTKNKGRMSPTREKLVRFRIHGDIVTDATLVSNFKSYITAHDPVLREAISEKYAKHAEGLNIEGLAFNKEGDQLLFGFRNPLKDNKAIILALENPAEVFNHEVPRFGKLLLIDLDGAGIRGLTYDPRLSGYLILARREDKKKMPFELWFWGGNRENVARRVYIKGVENLRRAEAVTPVTLDDIEGILIFSDEGNIRKNKPSSYIFLRYDQLSIDQ